MALIRIPYVNTHKDRYGIVRRYFRKRGCKPVPLPGIPGSAEFMAAYQAALGERAPVPGSRHGAGTVGALICDYLKSPAFTDLAESSKTLYRTILDRFSALHGHRMVHDMPRAKVAAYIFAIGAGHPAMANVTKAVLRKLLAHAVRLGYRNDNPVVEIDFVIPISPRRYQPENSATTGTGIGAKGRSAAFAAVTAKPAAALAIAKILKLLMTSSFRSFRIANALRPVHFADWDDAI
jgi:hypothetical protein